MKRFWKITLWAFLGFSGVAQESLARKVFIPLIANQSHHQPTTLTTDALIVTDQKVTVTGASLLRGTDLPLELGVLIDTSRSQRDAHLAEHILKPMNQFVDNVIRSSEDRVFFVKFDATSQITPWFKKEGLKDAVIKLEIGGGTALYDAIRAACEQRLGSRDWSKPTRRVLILVSDGGDNLSHITRDEAVADALRSGVTIFTINTDLTGADYRGVRTLESIAQPTGGESFGRVDGKDMSKVLATIKALIDGMYYLSYAPPDASKAAIHEVEIRPAPKEKFQLAYARKYFWNP
jgi:VWFA-related protein